MLLLFIFLAGLILGSFNSLEEQSTTQNMARILTYMNDQIAKLSTNTSNYAIRDSTYQFVQGKNPTYPETELSTNIVNLLNLDCALIIDKKGSVVLSNSANPSSGDQMQILDHLVTFLEANNTLLNQSDNSAGVTGWIMLPEGPIMISAHPIMAGNKIGSSAGTLIFAKAIDAQFLAQIKTLTQVDVAYAKYNDSNAPEDFVTAQEALSYSTTTIIVQPLSSGAMAGYQAINDINSKPIVLLRVSAESILGNQSTFVLIYLFIAALVASSVFGIVVWLTMGRYVLEPVSQLNNNVVAISAKNNPSARIPVQGDKEIADLSGSINSMLDQIERSQAEVRRSMNQLHAAINVTSTISKTLNQQEILEQVVNSTLERFDLYYVGVFLLDERNEYAVLKAGTGDAGQKMLAVGHRLPIGGASMIGWATANQKARIALDTGKEPIRFNNPYLPLTRSELAIPIISRSMILGAMTLQSSKSEAFEENDILVIQSIADNLAVALENARLFEQAQQGLDEIRTLNRTYVQSAWQDAMAAHGKLKAVFENPSTGKDASTEHQIHIPIQLRDQTLGYLDLETNASALNPEDQALISAITNQIAQALENARLVEQTQLRAAQEEKLNEFSLLFSRAMNIDDILQMAVKQLGELPSVSEVSVELSPQRENTSSFDHPEADHSQEMEL
jgi:sensor domain CHASE-containing protein/GAF domain-containing protein